LKAGSKKARRHQAADQPTGPGAGVGIAQLAQSRLIFNRRSIIDTTAV